MQLTTGNFIGRTEELSQFIHWLEDVDGSLIFYLHDALGDPAKKGGIGKTWLLRLFVSLIKGRKELQERFIPVFIDFFDVASRDGVVIAERIVQTLHEVYPHWPAQNFKKVLRQYHEILLQKKADTTGIMIRLSDALSDDLRLLQERMIESNISLLLLCDTFELIENNPIIAVLHTSHTFPETYNFDRIRVVIAGRNALNIRHQNWIGRENEITAVPLSPFTYEETIHYLDYYDNSIREDVSEEVLQALYQRTEGRPILLGLVIDVLSNPGKSLEELVHIPQASFEESLVTQINDFREPIKWVTFFMAHVYHRFDLAFLNLIMSTPGLGQYVPEEDYRELIERLPTLSFIRRSATSDDFVLHDEMRRLVNKYCWDKQDPAEDLRRDLSEIAVNYYEQLLNIEQHEGKRQSYVVEILFHHLVINKDEGFQFFDRYFNQAIQLSSRSFARSLFQEVQKFGTRLSDEQLYALRMDEARLLREEEDYAAALAIYEALERDNVRGEAYRSDLLYEKGPCYLRLGRYDEAIDCFNAGAEIERSNADQTRYAALLSRLGYIRRLQGRYSDAMKFYQEALKVQRNLDNPQEYANLLNNMANVLRLQGGKLEEALRFCKLALRIRRDLFKQNKISEATIALSQNTLGHIYHTLGLIDEEEKAYREAFEVYCRLGDRSALAHTHNNLGRVLVKKGDLEGALLEFRQASRIAAGENHGAEIESCNQQGRVFMQREEYTEAKLFFERAIALSRQFNLRFSLAENLLYLAETLDHLAQPSDLLIKEAKRIARENDYSYLLSLAGNIQGDMYFRRKEYQSAFRYYRISCRYMSQRGSPEFDIKIRKLNDQLLMVPVGFLPGIIDSLLSYWYELGLEEKYPQLPRVCQEIIRNTLL
jgi:tetratricopeptide (TPR) repeat protein